MNTEKERKSKKEGKGKKKGLSTKKESFCMEGRNWRKEKRGKKW